MANSKEFPALHDKATANVSEGMIQSLSEELGVSVSSLVRMQLGYLPIVQFHNAQTGEGWFGERFWTFPCRNAAGKITGLSLRPADPSKKKCYVPGSKPGVFYDPSGITTQDAPASRHVPIGQLGIECPICGKPDGCLADRAGFPRSILCCRQVSAIQVSEGLWLHSRNSNEGAGAALRVRPIVLVVEGATDVLAAWDLGFEAIGKPSNTTGNELLCNILKGSNYDAIFLGENDRKPDGRWPGRIGIMSSLKFFGANRLTNSKFSFPPEQFKDLRDWKRRDKSLTQEALQNWLTQTSSAKLDETAITDERWYAIAGQFVQFLEDDANGLDCSHLRYWSDSYYTYAAGSYVPLELPHIESALYEWGSKLQINGELLNVDLGVLANIRNAVRARTLVRTNKIPAWLCENRDEQPDPKNLIVYQNGILDVNRLVTGATSDILLPHTPDFFTLTGLPFAFDPGARYPHWEYYLRSTFEDEPEKRQLLQEWLGYCLVPDVSLQKMMFLRGNPGTGKGRVLEVLRDLVGRKQYVTSSFASLGGNFGVSPLVGKLVCALPDARATKNSDAVRGLELLLSITGSDDITVARKFKDPLEAQKIYARITLASNEYLDVHDHAGAMIRRLNVIQFNHDFTARPDHLLPDKLRSEIAGINNWALEGLARLRKQGHFTVPPSSAELLNDIRQMSSPVASFLSDCADTAPEYEVSVADLFDCWEEWRVEKRFGSWSKSRFMERMHSNALSATLFSRPESGNMVKYYRGLKLKEWAKQRYLRRA